MDGTKDDDGGVEAAMYSSTATYSTLTEVDDVGARAAGVQPGAHGQCRRRRRRSSAYG
jgi:hypothetical protein